MNFQTLFYSVFISTALICLLLWYTTEKEKNYFLAVFKLFRKLHEDLEHFDNNYITPLNLDLNVDFDKLKDSLEDCIDIVESKIDPEKDHYYNQNGIEAWDIINQVMEFHEGNISNQEAGILYNMMKYILRFPYKGQWDSDLNKICVYAQELKEDEG